jgi:hypothetical protein
MRTEDHLAKAARLERSIAKLNENDDYELIVWSSLHGGAHLVNAALHKLGITDESRDYIHSDKLESDIEIPKEVTDMLSVLHSIELLGPRFVRGRERADPEAMKFCLSQYANLKTTVEKLVQRGAQK